MDSSSISQFSQKILFPCKRTIWAQFAPKLFNLIYHLSQIFWKHFSMIGHNRLTKVVLVSFLQRSSFSTIEQFISNLGQNYGTLCPMQLFLMIHSLKILKCSRMGYSSYTKVMLLCEKFFLGGDKGNLGLIWDKVIHSYISWLTRWGSFWSFVAWWGIMHRQKWC